MATPDDDFSETVVYLEYRGIKRTFSPNLKPTWLAIIAGRARPDEPEVVGGVQGW